MIATDDLTARLRAKTPCCPDGPSMAFLHQVADRIDADARRIAELETDQWEVAKAYDHITGSMVSKPSTPAEGVIRAHDEHCHFKRDLAEAESHVAALKDLVEQLGLPAVLEALGGTHMGLWDMPPAGSRPWAFPE